MPAQLHVTGAAEGAKATVQEQGSHLLIIPCYLQPQGFLTSQRLDI